MRSVTRREFVIGGSALAMSPWIVSPAFAAQTIKIGGVYPLTGNLASTGLDCRRGVELAVDIINGKYDLNLPLAKTEGLPNLGGAKIEMVWADTKGEPRNGQAEAERLVTQDKVVGVHRRLPERGDQDRQPGHRAAEDSIRMFRLLFPHADRAGTSSISSGSARTTDASPRTSSVPEGPGEAPRRPRSQTVALLYENTEFGANVGKEEQKYAQEFGYKVVADISYAANATDVTSRGGPADQGQSGRPDARLLHHRCHPVHQDLQGDGTSTPRAS